MHFLDGHSHLFALDPFLLYCFTQAATLDQYKELITKVHLFMLLTAFLERVPQYTDHLVC